MSVDGVLRGIESLDISTQRTRLESANNVSAARATELTAASERISSIDYAQEVALMVRLQILAQTQTVTNGSIQQAESSDCTRSPVRGCQIRLDFCAAET